MTASKINIGIDIGGTTIRTGFVTLEGKVIVQNSMKTDPSRGFDNIIGGIIENIKKMVSDLDILMSEVNSIGIGVPGTVNSEEGIVVFAPNIFWENIQVSEKIKEAFDIPIFIVQDSRASAWGEYLFGSGKGYKNIASITLGTGIGCGMILDGKLFHGGLNTAGEFGHQIVVIDGHKCNCGRTGCLESYTAGLAIVREGKKIPGVEKLLQKSPEGIEVKDVFDLAKVGNADAIKITDTVVSYLGMGLVNLINLNSIELISISGGISNAPDELLFNPLKQFIQERAYSAISDKVKLVKSLLGDNAPMIGAASLCQSVRKGGVKLNWP
ncbi:MAG: ROK family protein [Prolixibacteraceae bacterium]